MSPTDGPGGPADPAVPVPVPEPDRDRDRSELRPMLGAEATVVLPRGGAAAPLPRLSRGGAVQARPLARGRQLHEYRIDGVLGVGGFGVTYLATDVHLKAAVAIKEYLPADIVFRAADGSVSPTASEHLPRYRQGLDAFLGEARTLASFRHPAIVQVKRFFEAHRTAYMVLEVESGEPLKSWWPAHRRIGEKALVELLLPLLDGLAAVHAAGFLHRDIKPDNIQVRASDGSLVLLDFGSAAQAAGIASQGLVVVTPGYAPIEQYGLGEQGPWTDLYALGATLYWIISGRKPPDAETRKADPRAYTRAVEAGRDVFGDAFLKAIDWALATDPARRPRSVAEFRDALCADHPASVRRFEAARQRAERAAAGSEPTQDRSMPTASRLRRSRPRARVHPRDWPLAVRLGLASALAGVVPVALASLLLLDAARDELVRAESRYLQSVAAQAASELAGYLSRGRAQARQLAADAAVTAWLARPAEATRGALRDRLLRQVQPGSGVQSVTLLDAAGLVVAASELGAQGTSQALRPVVLRALRGESLTGTLAAGNALGATHVEIAEPVREGGVPGAPVVGVLLLRLSGDPVVGAVDAAQAGAGAAGEGQGRRLTPFLVDGDRVLVHHPFADLRHRSLVPLSAERQAVVRADQRFRRDGIASLDETALAAALNGLERPGALVFASATTGRPALAGFAPVADHDWVVAVSQDRRDVVAPLATMAAGLAGAVLLAALLAGAAGWWLARGVSRPLRTLTRALAELRAGDLDDARVHLRRDDEFGQMARHLNAVVDKLREAPAASPSVPPTAPPTAPPTLPPPVPPAAPPAG